MLLLHTTDYYSVMMRISQRLTETEKCAKQKLRIMQCKRSSSISISAIDSDAFKNYFEYFQFRACIKSNKERINLVLDGHKFTPLCHSRTLSLTMAKKKKKETEKNREKEKISTYNTLVCAKRANRQTHKLWNNLNKSKSSVFIHWCARGVPFHEYAECCAFFFFFFFVRAPRRGKNKIDEAHDKYFVIVRFAAKWYSSYKFIAPCIDCRDTNQIVGQIEFLGTCNISTAITIIIVISYTDNAFLFFSSFHRALMYSAHNFIQLFHHALCHAMDFLIIFIYCYVFVVNE